MNDIKGHGIADATFSIVSSLDGFNPTILRRSGNTTRLIGVCIDIMFSGKTCLVRDHDLRGTNERMNQYLFSRVRDRINLEHGNIIELVCFDSKSLAIYLFKDLDERKAVELSMIKNKHQFNM